MDRPVKITVERWELQGNGKVKVKIKEKGFHITTLTHDGVPYITLKQYGRGRYMLKRDPSWVAPAPTLMELPQIDISPEPLAHPPDRAPMLYAGEVLP